MEKGRVSSALMICLVLVAAVNQATAARLNVVAFGICYARCFPRCLLRPLLINELCPLICLLPCFSKLSTLADTQSFCELGCASAMCSNISTKENYAIKEVENCVGGCSATCAKKN
ncbi:hypothetical protein like AT1G12660 [Hibiscus trionum]|uniref:Thionin-like protein 2 n=1 Tax=Hibiscus trionum TaxID=183268 RepID=A0A9W7HBX1_HIBTR|nr:hypothetical protein like AT1G12660 [Hibiscus trionum]